MHSSNSNDVETYYSVSAAAAYKGVAYNTIMSAIERGQLIPEANVVGVTILSKTQLDAYIPLKKSSKYLAVQGLIELDEFVEGV